MIAHFILQADVLASAFFIILLLIIQAYFSITIDFMYDQKNVNNIYSIKSLYLKNRCNNNFYMIIFLEKHIMVMSIIKKDMVLKVF